jgi:hypothetical protein
VLLVLKLVRRRAVSEPKFVALGLALRVLDLLNEFIGSVHDFTSSTHFSRKSGRSSKRASSNLSKNKKTGKADDTAKKLERNAPDST